MLKSYFTFILNVVLSRPVILLVTHHVQECQTKTPGAVLSRNASRLLFEVPSVELIVRRQREQFTASLLTS